MAGQGKDQDRKRTKRKAIAIIRRSCSDSLLTASQSDGVFGSDKRLISTVRRECLDRVLIFGESHLRQILSSYAKYYIGFARTWRWTRMRQWARGVQRTASIVAIPILFGLHHH